MKITSLNTRFQTVPRKLDEKNTNVSKNKSSNSIKLEADNFSKTKELSFEDNKSKFEYLRAVKSFASLAPEVREEKVAEIKAKVDANWYSTNEFSDLFAEKFSKVV